MKKLLSLLLVLSMVLSMAACAVKAPAETGASTSTEPSVPTTDPSAGPTDSTEPSESTEPTTPEADVIVPNPADKDLSFQDFALGFFTEEMLGGDYASLNQVVYDVQTALGITLPDPEEAEWYTYTGYSEEDLKSDLQLLADYREQMSIYDYSSLSAIEKSAYTSISYVLNYYDSLIDPEHNEYMLLGGSYVDAYGGYVASVIETVSSWSFNSVWALDSLCNLLESTDEAFATYPQYLADRAAAGIALKDADIQDMIDFCQGVLDTGKDFSLLSYIPAQVNTCNFLNADQKAAYIERLCNALTNDYFSGIRTLIGELDDFKGKNTDTTHSYLAVLESGKDYYYAQAQVTLGIHDLDLNALYEEMEEYAGRLEIQLNNTVTAAQRKAVTDPDGWERFYNYVMGEDSVFNFSSPEQMLAAILSVSTNLITELSSKPSVTMKFLDETVGAYASYSAVYHLSYIDRLLPNEFITVNPMQVNLDDLESIVTVAHEGYPGHMYSYVYAKELNMPYINLMGYSKGVSEGWSQYTGVETLRLLGKASTDWAVQYACEYTALYEIYQYIMMGLYDIAVNYYGYNSSKLEKTFGADGAMIINFLENMPAQYLPYSYGMMAQYKAHEQAKIALGSAYSEQNFNGYILSAGFSPTFDTYWEYVDAYIAANSK